MPLKSYLFPDWMHYSIGKKKSSFNLWITLIFTLHLSFSLYFSHLHTSKLFLAKHKAANLESWVCSYLYDHYFGAIYVKWIPVDLGHTANSFHFFPDSSNCAVVNYPNAVSLPCHGLSFLSNVFLPVLPLWLYSGHNSWFQGTLLLS